MAQPEVHGPFARSLHDKMVSYAERGRSVLVFGSTGVGKEALLRTYVGHRRWGYEGKIINCAAIPSDILESELFGHRKGAFTGASADRVGLVASAACLALDEIGDAAPALQAKILRVIENGEYRRVGDDEVRNTNCVFVAATNKPEQLRNDLLWRFESRISVPDLADRRTDLVHILFAVARRAGVIGFMERCLAFLAGEYTWPGNAREVRFVVQEAADDAAASPVDLGNLPLLPLRLLAEELETGHSPEPGEVFSLDDQARDRAVARFGATIDGISDAEIALAMDRLNYASLLGGEKRSAASAQDLLAALPDHVRDRLLGQPAEQAEPLRRMIEDAPDWKEAARVARREWYQAQLARGLRRSEIAAVLGVTPQALGQALRRDRIV